MWTCRYSVQCFHLKSCPVHSSHAPTALPHFQTPPVTSAAWFYFQPKTGAARRWNFLYMEKKYCKIVSASEAENCVRCPNRFPRFFSSKPFIHQACLWCSGHLWSPSIGQCLSVAVGVCQRERLRADFAHAARRAYPRDTHAALQHFRGWTDFWRSPGPFSCRQGQPLPASSCTSGWYHSRGPQRTRCAPCTPCAPWAPCALSLSVPHHRGPQRLSACHMEGFKDSYNQRA